MKILVVDDHHDTCEWLSEVLTGAGYQALTANTLQDGVDAISSEAPDLLIVDVRLGMFNGLQLVALSEKPIPAIVITGLADPGLKREAHQLEADYLIKPVEPSTLLTLVEKKLAALASALRPLSPSM